MSSGIIGKKIKLLLFVFIFMFSCSAPFQEIYLDTYFEEDRIYQNEDIGFTLMYRGNWVIQTDPQKMGGKKLKLAKTYASQGVDLLYVGATSDGMQGTKGIAVNYNVTAMNYAEKIRGLNKEDAEEDKGLKEMIAGGRSMVMWEYKMFGFNYAEFFFTVDTYNIRIAFWTTPDRYNNFLPVYEEIMSTVSTSSIF